ncbi:MAG: HAMP domain-containing protein [Asticcacaulis sp.]
MKLSIGHKLSAASLVFVVAMAAFLLGAWSSLSHLRQLQDRGMSFVRTATTAEKLSGKGAALYQIVADAEINHQLDQTATDWAAEKQRTETLFSDLRAQLNDADDKALIDQAETGYKSYVDLFENRMLPALQASGEMTQDIRDLDGQIDSACDTMTGPLMKLSANADAKAQASDKDFDTLSGRILALGVGIGLLALTLGSAINFIAVRHISGPLKTLSRLLHKLVNGEDVASVPHEGRRDEVGEIAHAVSAFKTNVAAVRRLEGEQAVARARLEKDNLNALQVLKSAESFERQIKAVAERVGMTSHDLNAAAAQLNAAARDADQRSASMSAATAQSSSNLQTVASATEELSASINEIGRQVEGNHPDDPGGDRTGAQDVADG